MSIRNRYSLNHIQISCKANTETYKNKDTIRWRFPELRRLFSEEKVVLGTACSNFVASTSTLAIPEVHNGLEHVFPFQLWHHSRYIFVKISFRNFRGEAYNIRLSQVENIHVTFRVFHHFPLGGVSPPARTKSCFKHGNVGTFKASNLGSHGGKLPGRDG